MAKKETNSYPASSTELLPEELYLKDMNEAELFQSILSFGQECMLDPEPAEGLM